MTKTLRGYTAQARWYAANLDENKPPVGWTRLGQYLTKPVFETLTGERVIIVTDADARAGCVEAAGLNHLSVRVLSCTTPIVKTEEELWPART